MSIPLTLTAGIDGRLTEPLRSMLLTGNRRLTDFSRGTLLARRAISNWSSILLTFMDTAFVCGSVHFQGFNTQSYLNYLIR